MRTPALVAVLLLVVVGGIVVVAADEREEPIRPSHARQTQQPPGGSSPVGPVAHLRELQRIADRNGGNRAAGTKGYDESAAYVAERLRGAGYTVRTQRVSFPFFDERRRPTLAVAGRTLRARRDFRTLSYSGSGTVRARARRVAGDGCSARDYSALRSGEVALVPRRPCTLRRKAVLAQRAGAGTVLIVNQENTVISGTLGSPGVRIPALFLSSSAGQGLDGREVRVATHTTSEKREARNVIADSPGDESGRVVMAGAHLDSVEDGPGINDNGSGSAAVLDAAERLARSGARLRFGFWAAEELGLYGSERYVRSLSRAERRRIEAYVNLDMVGSPNPIRAVYDTDDRVERALRRGLDRATNRPIEEERLGGASDHASFADAGIKVGGLFTGASERKSAAQARRQGGRANRPLDPCYHRACDRFRNVNQDVLEEMTEAVTTALRDLSRR